MTVDEARAEARRQWGNLSPYRLGRVRGFHGAGFAYPYSNHAARLFWQGVEVGEDNRRRRMLNP